MKTLISTVMALILSPLLAAQMQADPRLESGPGRMCSDGQFGPVQCIRAAHQVFDTCQMLQGVAREHFLDPGFFTRLIWQDSRLAPAALRADRLVGDPQLNDDKPGLGHISEHLNFPQIVEKTGRYLAYLRQENGNQGLAAMAYAAGERGAFGFMAGNVALRQSSVDYVQIVTGLHPTVWRNEPPAAHDFRLAGDKPFLEACFDLARGRGLARFKPPAVNYAPWGAQVGYGHSQHDAELQQLIKTRACRPEVEAQRVEYIPVPNRFASRPTLWMARLAQPARDGAIGLCAALRQKGCACQVTKNP